MEVRKCARSQRNFLERRTAVVDGFHDFRFVSGYGFSHIVTAKQLGRALASGFNPSA
jgi:hypothetical protein